MATAAQALASVKNRVGIKSTDTTFDVVINDFVGAAVLRLYPRAALEVDYQDVTSISVDSYGECTIDISALTTSISAARRVEAWDGYTWRRISDTLHHGKYLRLRGLSQTTDTKVRLFGIKPFPAIDNVNDFLLQAVYWFAMAEFYDYLAGDKSKYNIYMQNTGARAVDNMHDESAYFDQKANDYISQQKQVYGL
jgi:hypothetical protein